MGYFDEMDEAIRAFFSSADNFILNEKARQARIEEIEKQMSGGSSNDE